MTENLGAVYGYKNNREFLQYLLRLQQKYRDAPSADFQDLITLLSHHTMKPPVAIRLLFRVVKAPYQRCRDVGMGLYFGLMGAWCVMFGFPDAIFMKNWSVFWGAIFFLIASTLLVSIS